MAYLKYYDREQELLPEAYGVKLDEDEVGYVYSRLQGHYHFQQRLELRGQQQRGWCGDYKIKLPRNVSVGLISHEIAHAIHHKRLGERSHTKKHFKLMKRVSEFTLTHLPEWRQSLGKQQSERELRLVERVRKLEAKAAYIDSPQGKLDKLKTLEAKWTTRQKRAETKLKKIRRRIKIWELKVSA